MRGLVCLSNSHSTAPAAAVGCYLRSTFPARTQACLVLHPLPRPDARPGSLHPTPAVHTQSPTEVQT